MMPIEKKECFSLLEFHMTKLASQLPSVLFLHATIIARGTFSSPIKCKSLSGPVI